MFTRWWYTSTSHPPSMLRWNQHNFLFLPIFSPKHLRLCSCVISSHPYSFVHTNRRFIASPEKGCRACVTICMLNRTIKLLHLNYFHYLPFVWWVFSRLFFRLFFRLFLGLVHGWTSIFVCCFWWHGETFNETDIVGVLQMAIPYHINLLLATSGQQRMKGGGGVGASASLD